MQSSLSLFPRQRQKDKYKDKYRYKKGKTTRSSLLQSLLLLWPRQQPIIGKDSQRPCAHVRSHKSIISDTFILIHYIVIWWYDNKYWCTKLKHNYFLFQDDEMKGCYMKEGNNVFGPLDQPLFQITLRESLFTVLNCISSSSGNNGFYQTLLQAMDRLEGNEKYTKVQIFLNRIFPWKSIAPRIYSGGKSVRLQQSLLTWPIRTLIWTLNLE